jgi:hypothetical protein
MGSGSNPSQTTTSSQQSMTTPPSYALSVAQEGLGQAKNLKDMRYGPFPYVMSDPLKARSNYTNIMTGETLPWRTVASGQAPYMNLTAPMNEQQQYSLGNIANYANNPNPIINNAYSDMTNTLGGGYLNPQSNPYLAQYAQQALGDVSRNYENSVVPQLSASAQRAGAFGGSADTLLRSEAMKNYGDTLSKTATGIYNPAYESERTRMMQYQGLAPTTTQMPVQQAQAGLGVGDAYQQQAQNELNNWVKQYQQAQQWPFYTSQAAASQFPIYGAGSTTYNSGTSTTESNAGSNNPFSNIFGGALSGIGTGLMASAIPGIGPGMAAGIGALPFLSSFFK